MRVPRAIADLTELGIDPCGQAEQFPQAGDVLLKLRAHIAFDRLDDHRLAVLQPGAVDLADGRRGQRLRFDGIDVVEEARGAP